MSLQTKGKVQTVLGPIAPSDLGVTLCHEHLLWDASFMYVEPEDRSLGEVNVSIENLEWLKRHGLGNKDNLMNTSVDVAVDELNRFKAVGGSTVIDMGNNGLHRDPVGLAQVSKSTGVNIVMGAGYYVGASHPKSLVKQSVREITSEIISDITIGVGDSGVKAGVIGEIGCSYPLLDTELKVLEASAYAQTKAGVSVNVHPGQSQASPMEILDLYRSFGGDPERIAFSHIGNRHGLDIDLTIELAKTGCYIDYDSFGNYQNPIVLPEKTFYALDDWDRINCIVEMKEAGFLDKLLIAHDVFNKTDLKMYGGFGYDHIHTTVIPLMHMNGLTNEDIQKMLVDNPAQFYQIK